MESYQQVLKKRNKKSQEEEEDVEMINQEETSVDSRQRKVVKVKRKLGEISEKFITEEGEEIEFEGEDVEHDDIDEDVVQNDDSDDEEGDGWVDVGDADDDEEAIEIEEEEEKKQQDHESKVWDEKKRPLLPGEELVYDSSAYKMLHRSQVEWPCLSVDFLVRERITEGQTSYPRLQSWFPHYIHNLDPQFTIPNKKGGSKHRYDKYPYTTYMCAGSQAQKKHENKIFVMKWSNMLRQQPEKESSETDSSDEDEPILRFEQVPHKGAINRIRSMHGSGVVATWNEDAEVGIYDVTKAVIELDLPQNQNKKNKQIGGCKLAGFRLPQEGFALDWSPLTLGRLAAGCCNSQIYLFQATDETCTQFVKETEMGLQGHKKSVEDLQFSPTQEQVIASCSVDRTIKIWDLRATKRIAQATIQAHDCDVNVISWNSASEAKYLLASGDDKGEFKVWDLRTLQDPNQQFEPITAIKWHTDAITSIQFEPGEETVLAVCSADNRFTLWDFSVVESGDFDKEIPPQLMFLHQGQSNLKELRFHPQFESLIFTTAEDSFNLFRPNLDEEDQKMGGPTSEDEEEKEERKMMKMAKMENRKNQVQENANKKKKKKSKRTKNQ